MKEFIFHAFSIIILLAVNIIFSAAHDEAPTVASDVTKSQFPYMAFLYYPDETVTENKSSRFFQSAILIKVDWLISAAIDIGNDSFPVKTLMARAGVVIVDRNFTLNEDDDEQEREIIQVILPEKQNGSMKWVTDISLLKTLIPFNVTNSVKPVTLNNNVQINEKMCKILAYVNNQGLERKLVQVTIELLPAECDQQFNNETMTCGTEVGLKAEYKGITNSKEFCDDNAGGPLLCEEEVIGTQIYSDKETCNTPRLYQLLSKWHNFIMCGTQFDCRKAVCGGVCEVIRKDEVTDKPSTTLTTAPKEIRMLDSDKATNIAPVFRTHKELEISSSEAPKELPIQRAEVSEIVPANDTEVITVVSTSSDPITSTLSTTEITKVSVTETPTVFKTRVPKVKSAKAILVSSDSKSDQTDLSANPLTSNITITAPKLRKTKKLRLKSGSEKLHAFSSLLYGVLFAKCLI